MATWLSGLIPASFIELLIPISLVIIGHLVEKKFVSRPSIFANALAINVLLIQIGTYPPLLEWYANIGAIVGLAAIISYSNKGSSSLSGGFYNFTKTFYNSGVIGLLFILHLGGVF